MWEKVNLFETRTKEFCTYKYVTIVNIFSMCTGLERGYIITIIYILLCVLFIFHIFLLCFYFICRTIYRTINTTEII